VKCIGMKQFLILGALASVVIYAFAHSSPPAADTTPTASAVSTAVAYHYNGKTAEEFQSGATPTPTPVPTPTPFQPFLTDEQKAKGVTLETAMAAATPTPTPLAKGVSETVLYIGAADENHLYFDSDDQRAFSYDSDPVAYSKGWKLGWLWATSQGTVGNDAVIEKAERKHWKDTDSTPAMAFFEAAATVRRIGQTKEEATAGAPPHTDGAWGVSLRVHDAIKSVLRDPDSYKYIGVSGPWHDTHNGKSCWLEKVHFRAKNGFGGYAVDTASVWIVVDGISEIVQDVTLSSAE
jgi:hypothetical protein